VPVQEIFSSLLTCTIFQFHCPLAQQAEQAAVLGHLSLGICLWKKQTRLTTVVTLVSQHPPPAYHKILAKYFKISKKRIMIRLAYTQH
jgi:hypothetical protein